MWCDDSNETSVAVLSHVAWEQARSGGKGKKRGQIGKISVGSKLSNFFNLSKLHLEFKYVFTKATQWAHADIRYDLTCWHFNDKLIVGGRICGIKGMSPGYATLSPRQTNSRLASLADVFFSPSLIFFLLFPSVRSLVLGYFTWYYLFLEILQNEIWKFRWIFTLARTFGSERINLIFTFEFTLEYERQRIALR